MDMLLVRIRRGTTITTLYLSDWGLGLKRGKETPIGPIPKKEKWGGEVRKLTIIWVLILAYDVFP